MAVGHLVILTILSCSISTIFMKSGQIWDCEKDNMNIVLVYDCRKDLNEQHNLFRQLILAVQRRTHVAVKRKLNIALMTYTYFGLEIIDNFTVTVNSSNFPLDSLDNVSKDECPESLPYENIIQATDEALSYSGEGTKKLAIFVILENITSNNSDSDVLHNITNEMTDNVRLKRLFIIINDDAEVLIERKYMIRLSMLTETPEAVQKCLYFICDVCMGQVVGVTYRTSCYYRVNFNMTQMMSAEESSEQCNQVSKGSDLISFNSYTEENNVFRDFKKPRFIRFSIPNKYTNYRFIGLQGLTYNGVKRYIWRDGSQMVLKHDLNRIHANITTCFYVSSRNFGRNTHWNEIECQKKIPIQVLLCEKQMYVASVKNNSHISFKSYPKPMEWYTFPESYINLIKFNLNMTSTVSPQTLVHGKLLIKTDTLLCDYNSGNFENIFNDIICNQLKAISFKKHLQENKFPGQIYISNQSGLNTHLTYIFLNESNDKTEHKAYTTLTTNTSTDLHNDFHKRIHSFHPVNYFICNFDGQILKVLSCLYDIKFRGSVGGCAVGYDECEHFECPQGYFKCPQSYCTPLSLLLDGIKDCPDGEDENLMKLMVCSARLKLALRDTCIARSLYEPPGNHSRFLCQDECQHGYVCVSKLAAVNYSNPSKVEVITTDIDIEILNDYNHTFLTPQAYSFFPFYHILEIGVAGCKISNLNKVFRNFDFKETLVLNIGSTSLTIGKFPLPNLKLLNASYHGNVQKLYFPPSVEIIDLSHTRLSQNVFLKLTNLTQLRKLFLCGIKSLNVSFDQKTDLDVLDLRRSTLIGLKEGYLALLTIQTALYSDDFKICCEEIRGQNIPEDKCHAPTDAISTCHDLIGDPVKRVILWLVCVVTLIGNLFVLVYKLVWDRAILSKAYGMFVACLGCSDLIMGLYLLVIAGADIHYRSLYVLEDSNWRESSVCKLAGVLSTFSSQTSTPFICLITLDRYLHVRYTFGEHTLTKRHKVISISLIVAFGVVASAVPLLVPGWKIYSSNALCLALPFSARRHRGWQYSTALFVAVNFLLFILIAVGQILIFRSFLSKKTDSFSSIKRSTRKLQEAIAKQLFLVTMSNFCCWFPICGMGVASTFGYQFNREIYAWSAVLILPINSAINPLIYTMPGVYKKLRSFFHS